MAPQQGGGTSVTAGDAIAIPDADLRRLYADYRVRQARSLLTLMPNEAVRPLYRRAMLASRDEAPDPMDALVRFAESMLPLPPFEVWLDDLRRHPESHWRDLEGSADVPSPTTPATVDTRRIRVRAQGWDAHLRGFRDQDAWRGFIAFEDVGVVPRRVHRTALIFREDSLEELRERFQGFESTSLEAFLRSTLP